MARELMGWRSRTSFGVGLRSPTTNGFVRRRASTDALMSDSTELLSALRRMRPSLMMQCQEAVLAADTARITCDLGRLIGVHRWI